MPSLLIRNSRVARDDGTVVDADVFCDNGIIERIEPSLDRTADEAIDAKGLC